MDADSRELPLELSGASVLGRAGGVVPPDVEDPPEVVELGAEADAAVGVERADLVEVLAELAEAADVGGVEELDGEVELGGHVVLDEVEHVLLVLPEEAPPPLLPRAVEVDGLGRRPHEEEAAVGEVAQAVGVAHVHVAGNGDVRRHGDVAERVTEPHHVNVLRAIIMYIYNCLITFCLIDEYNFSACSTHLSCIYVISNK